MIVGFVHGQTLRINASGVVADTINYLTARFTFQTSDWDGLEIWVHFAKGEDTYDIRLDDGQITQDMRLNLSAGKWQLYLHGNRYDGGTVVQRVTTEVKTFEVAPTGMLDGEPFPTVPPSAGEQIIAAAEQTVRNTLQEAKASGEFDGEPGVTPHIGSNGNWWIGDTDTGVQAQGEPGKDGQDGQPGADYVLTAADKTEIAQIAVGLLPKYAGEVENA